MTNLAKIAVVAVSTALCWSSGALAQVPLTDVQSAPADIIRQMQSAPTSDHVVDVPSHLRANRQDESREDDEGNDDDDDDRDERRREGGQPDRVSPLEADFSARADARLRLVGYQSLRSATGDTLAGAISDNYRLGIGDIIVLTVRGHRNTTYRAEVDREGRVVFPDLMPVPAAGRSFGEFSSDLKAQVSAAYLQTDAFVSLGSVRQISVLVSGEVEAPGVLKVSGLATALDALAAAGGIRKTGSLRRVRLVRGAQVREIDLYDILLAGSGTPDVSLQDGDRLVIPTLGPTVAVAGEVLRPGIYELAGPSITHDRLLDLAGGTLRADGLRHARLESTAAGLDSMQEIAATSRTVLGRGDILMVNRMGEGRVGVVTVEGAVTRDVSRSLARAPSLGGLLREIQFDGSPYFPLMIIRTRDPQTMMQRYVPIDAYRVWRGEADQTLRDQDRVIVLSVEDIRYLASADVQNVLRNRPPVSDEICGGLRALSATVTRRAARGAGGAWQILHDAQGQAVPDVQPCPQVFVDHPDLLPLLVDQAVSLQGEVRAPGVYPVADRARFADLLATAGGFSGESDVELVEISRDAVGTDRQSLDVQASLGAWLRPGDVVRANPRFGAHESGPVVLQGEVRRPGAYTIRRGETLSDLLLRAGGLTEQAFSPGAVFSRQSVREQEAESYQRLAREMETGLASALVSQQIGTDVGGGDLVLAARQLIESLREAEPLGRVVVEVDPAILQVRPEQDTVLQPGDRLVIPKRPTHVMVTGEVLHSSALQYVAGQSVEDYIRKAGGFRKGADTSRVFVVLPSGEARPLRVAFWNHEAAMVPPGSSIVVPRDLTPFSFWTAIKDVSGVVGNLAITAASLAVISK